MKKVRVGVLGGARGGSMVNFCATADNAEIVAICDKNKEVLDLQRSLHPDLGITFYDNFDEFVKHDMDAVVLANYANQHAPFAIRCMEQGLHVFSEVLPVQTVKEAVELIECVEKTGKIYAYGENYCFMPAPREMRKLYREGKIGEFEYGEGEYIHNCESIWPQITYGEKDHWRNNMYSTFYCTHSLGPIVHVTGLRPVRVTGYESVKNERRLRCGSKGAEMGIEMVEFENGGIAKSIHGGLYRNSIWYAIYGSKGEMESGREGAMSDVMHIHVNADEYSGQYEKDCRESYEPEKTLGDIADSFGHGGSDYYTMYYFIRKILGDPKAETVDVYEAMDMFLPGLFAYRSILAGGVPVELPNLRDVRERDKWRNDTACTDPETAGDQLLECCSTGNPDIPDAVYDEMRRKYEEAVRDSKK